MKILLAVDGSACSEVAVNEVARRPWPEGSQLKIISVVEPPPITAIPDTWGPPSDYYDLLEQAGRNRASIAIEKALTRLRSGVQPGMQPTTEIITGLPKEVILQEAETWEADLVVVAPATPQDNYSLLRAAIDCGDPVVYMEHKELWGLQAEVAQEKISLGKARVVREGKDVTLVTWSRTLHAALEAADKAKLSVEVIDLRTLWPWDRESVFASVRKTKKLLVVHEAVQVAGFGAEIAATVSEELGLPVKRLGAPRVPVGYSKPLEDEARITARRIGALLE